MYPEGRGGGAQGELYVNKDQKRSFCHGRCGQAGREHYFMDTWSQRGATCWASPVAPRENAWGECRGRRREDEGKTTTRGTYPLLITKSPRFGQWLPLLQGAFLALRAIASMPATTPMACIPPGENKLRGMVVNSRIWLHPVMPSRRRRPKHLDHHHLVAEVLVNYYNGMLCFLMLPSRLLDISRCRIEASLKSCLHLLVGDCWQYFNSMMYESTMSL